MAFIDVVNIKGEKVSELELVDSIFNVPIKPHVLHTVVKMQLAKRRAGTASTKNRSEVSGSGRKLYRQKGTGRARRGDITSPILRGGAVTFGPRPRSYEIKVPKKVRRLALKMALSAKFNDRNLIILDRFELERPKTKEFIRITDVLDINNALFIVKDRNRNLELSARNVQKIKILTSDGLNVYDILKFKKLVLLEDSLKKIEGRLLQ